VSKSSIRSLFLEGPAGKLEAVLNTGSANPAYAALVAHPHPLYGGTMHNKVVYHAAKTLNELGFPVLRFNFRGAGNSQGEHDHGRGEVEDVRAALEWLAGEFRTPIVFAGFSFGAAVGLRAACPDSRVQAVIALGLPLDAEAREYEYAFLGRCPKPKLFISGDQDQFASRQALSELVAGLPGPHRLISIAGADHFFTGALPALQAAIKAWVEEILLRASY
jgi:alpha/beta superfamily hydrolase